MMKTVDLHLIRMDEIGERRYRKLYENASEERRARADRYAKLEDAKRCIIAGALLQQAMRQRGLNPSLKVQTGKNGKPYIEKSKFFFNLSHGGDYVVLALSEHDIGVDVEQIVRRYEREKIAKHYFSESERQDIFQDEDSAEIARRFTMLWTMKESYLKFLGTGLTRPLNSFSIDRTSGILTDRERESAQEIQFHTFFPDELHCVTVCGCFSEVLVKTLRGDDLLH